MPVSKEFNLHRENRLLAALPAAEYQRLVADLEFVELPLKQVLYNADELITHVYFPHRAIASLTYTLEDGSTNEVGMVGNEGMVGLPVIWGGDKTNTESVVQVADGLRG
jgi:CRP-like cAMP-binding protein